MKKICLSVLFFFSAVFFLNSACSQTEEEFVPDYKGDWLSPETRAGLQEEKGALEKDTEALSVTVMAEEKAEEKEETIIEKKKEIKTEKRRRLEKEFDPDQAFSYSDGEEYREMIEYIREQRRGEETGVYPYRFPGYTDEVP